MFELAVVSPPFNMKYLEKNQKKKLLKNLKTCKFT